MEHITIVWIPPRWIPQCQEMVVDEWCHQTGTTTEKKFKKTWKYTQNFQQIKLKVAIFKLFG